MMETVSTATLADVPSFDDRPSPSHDDDNNDGAPPFGSGDPSWGESSATTTLATDPKVMDALRDLDGMWSTADPSGHTSVVTDPRQLEALKQMDDLWRDGQQQQQQQKQQQRRNAGSKAKVSQYYSDRVEDESDDDDSEDEDGAHSNGGQQLRESIWTKQSAATEGNNDDEEEGHGQSSSDDELPLVGGKEKKQKAKEIISKLGMGGGTALLAMAFADAVDEEEDRTSGRPRTSRKSHEREGETGNVAKMPRINPLALIGGMGLGGDMSDYEQRGGLMESGDGDSNDHAGYSDTPNARQNTRNNGKGGIFGLGRTSIKRSSSTIDGEGFSVSAPLSRRMDRQGGTDDEVSDDVELDNEKQGITASSANGNRGPTQGAPWSRNKSKVKMEGIGSEDPELRKRNARRLFFRNLEERERSDDNLELERMEIAGEDLEGGKKPFWESKVGKIAKGILVPEIYGDEAIEEIEGDQSNRQKGKYGQLSTDEDEEKVGASNDKRNRSRKIDSMRYEDDNKALEETLRDQIRMLGSQVMELEGKLMEKTDQVATLSARVKELESKLAEYEVEASESESEEEEEAPSNLIDFDT
jgi:hypothetical protein